MAVPSRPNEASTSAGSAEADDSVGFSQARLEPRSPVAAGPSTSTGETPPYRPWYRRPAPRLMAVAAALFLLLGADSLRPVEEQLAARAALVVIEAYQEHLSPILGHRKGVCRFRPSCSAYAKRSIRKHGFLRGSLKSGHRLLRCGPWTERSTYDPA